MGYEKDRLIQQEDQGWNFSGGTRICWRCVSQPYLRKYVKEQANGHTCSFCNWTTKDPSTVHFDDVMEIIANAIRIHYNDAANETIPWDDEDHTYLGSTYTTSEIVRYEIPTPSNREDVIEHIIDCLPDYEWCQRHFASLTHEDQYKYGWEEFCRTIKHERRFLFQQIEPSPHADGIPVKDMLQELGEVVVKHGYIRRIPAGTRFYRIRIHERTLRPTQAHELGPPPEDHTLANRMSPAGISLFYAAMDERTAAAETFTRNGKQYGTISAWETNKELTFVDFTHEPYVPSFYDADASWDRDELLFLYAFVGDITKPVVLDGREHIEYVPTQVVTEYFRHAFTVGDGKPVDGMLYPSARRKGGICAVLFYGNEYFVPTRIPIHRAAPFVLVPEGVRGLHRRVRKRLRTDVPTPIFLQNHDPV